MALHGILERAMPLPRRLQVCFAPANNCNLVKVLTLREFVGAKELNAKADQRGRQARRGF